MSTITEQPTGPPLHDPLIDPSTPTPRPRGGSSKLKRDTHRWSRLIHVYTSMIALVVVLFFAATGLTLNHPEWTFGTEVTSSTEAGTLPFATQLVDTDGAPTGIDYLSVAEHVRSEFGVIGSVDSFGETNGEGFIAFVNPGYRADVIFVLETDAFELVIEQEGWVAQVNDLHKGRSSGDAWSWVIDVSAVFLVAISLTGLVMQFFLAKRRRSALITAGVGGLITLALVIYTLN